MRRFLLLLTAGATALGLTGVGGAAVPGDRASGTGTAGPCIVAPAPGFCLPERTFKFFAHTTPTGDVHGIYRHTTATGSIVVGKVTCMEVDGNRAVFGGTTVKGG